jgi:hypothetical protein
LIKIPNWSRRAPKRTLERVSGRPEETSFLALQADECPDPGFLFPHN